MKRVLRFYQNKDIHNIKITKTTKKHGKRRKDRTFSVPLHAQGASISLSSSSSWQILHSTISPFSDFFEHPSPSPFGEEFSPLSLFEPSFFTDSKQAVVRIRSTQTIKSFTIFLPFTLSALWFFSFSVLLCFSSSHQLLWRNRGMKWKKGREKNCIQREAWFFVWDENAPGGCVELRKGF